MRFAQNFHDFFDESFSYFGALEHNAALAVEHGFGKARDFIIKQARKRIWKTTVADLKPNAAQMSAATDVGGSTLIASAEQALLKKADAAPQKVVAVYVAPPKEGGGQWKEPFAVGTSAKGKPTHPAVVIGAEDTHRALSDMAGAPGWSLQCAETNALDNWAHANLLPHEQIPAGGTMLVMNSGANKAEPLMSRTACSTCDLLSRTFEYTQKKGQAGNY